VVPAWKRLEAARHVLCDTSLEYLSHQSLRAAKAGCSV
jgi:hypothetical protein